MRLIGNVEKDAQVRAVASGALGNGDTVVVNSDGTVSVVAETSVSLSVGSPSSFESAQTGYTSTTFDSANNKVVIAYSDEGNNNYGTAVVGTVSGTSISFGTPVVFTSASIAYTTATFDTASGKVVIACQRGGSGGGAIVGTVSGTSISFGAFSFIGGGTISYLATTFDSDAGKVVVAYRDNSNSNRGTAVVGTVSGTSISYGSSVVFETGITQATSATYDTNAQKVVIAFRDDSNSNYGKAVVGTVSGTSISFGSPVTFEADTINETAGTATTFDSTNNKVVIVYGSNDGTGRTIVGTVSGTSISFGSFVDFSTQEQVTIAVTFDSNSNKVVISFRDQGSSGAGKAIVGTVSGTSISFGTPVSFDSGSTDFISTAFDSNLDRVVISYTISGGSNSYAVVLRNAAIVPNLTSENFLGFAAHTYADGQSALVNSTCTVDRNQSGLTAGQTYYVQTDGSLGTTAADPSVVAGTAISSTEIIVKG